MRCDGLSFSDTRKSFNRRVNRLSYNECMLCFRELHKQKKVRQKQFTQISRNTAEKRHYCNIQSIKML